MITDENNINTAILNAKIFLEQSIIEKQIDNKKVYAFSEHIGKDRITEWGGTSSAISCLYAIDRMDSSGIEEKLDSAKKWLLSRNKNGAWDSSEMYCCEATAAILHDLQQVNCLPEYVKTSSLQYIKNCYGKGYFKSTPNVRQKPHIYTTYLAVKTLKDYNCLEKSMSNDIVHWIKEVQNKEKKWGETPENNNSSVPHTVFALLILCYCGESLDNIKKEYVSTIKWLKKEAKDCKNKYASEQIERYINNGDECGDLPKNLNLGHCYATILCDFFMFLKDETGVLICIITILKTQSKGGWGVDNNKLSMWATQQSVDCLIEYNKQYIKRLNRFRIFWVTIPNKMPKIIISSLLLFVFVWITKSDSRMESFLVGIILMIIPWFFDRTF